MKKLLVIFAAIALVGGFTATAMAADWAFYGSARVATFWENQDVDNNPTAEDEDLLWFIQGNSRIGAKVKHDTVAGHFEYGTGVNLRRLYGTWDFGSGKFTVGQDYTPITVFYSGQVFDSDNGLLGQGNIYGSRRGQARLEFGGFQIAAIQITGDDARGVGEVDTYLPKIEARFSTSADQWSFDLFGGFQQYEIDTPPGPVDDIDIQSWAIGAGGGFNFGAGYLKASISWGENTGDMAYFRGAKARLNAAGNDVDDAAELQGLILAGFKASDMVTFEAGAGYYDVEYDNDDDSMDYWGFYVQSVLTVGPGVYIVPEFGYYDKYVYNSNTINDDASYWYLGAKWQINF
jgi:hypothetical protein